VTSLRERKRSLQVDAFVVAALELFESKGFAETTIDEIAERAVLSRSTFFRYFGTKEDVLFAGLPQWLTVLEDTLAAELPQRTPWEAVTTSLRLTARGFFEQNRALATRLVALWMAEPALRARYVEHAESWEQTIAAALTDAHAHDPATTTYATALAIAAIGAFRSAAQQFNSTGEDFLERFDATLELMGQGLATSRPT
jgi:AcrR family transcriptional regulator